MRLSFPTLLVLALGALHAAGSAQAPAPEKLPPLDPAAAAMRDKANAAFERRAKERMLTAAEIDALIHAERFEEFEAQARRYDTGWTRDLPLEINYVHLFGDINGDNASLQQKLDKWVEQRPSFISYGARGFYALNRGYALRGDKWVRDTPAPRMQAMRRYHEAAEQDLREAVRMNPRFTPGYQGLISRAMASGGRGEIRSLLEEAVAASPSTYYVRVAYMQSLGPKWGGSFKKMQTYADSIDAAAKLNPLVWTLKGDPAAQRGEQAWRDEDWGQAYAWYSQALQYGNRQVFLTGRANAARGLQRYDEAYADFEKCRQLAPIDTGCAENAARMKAKAAQAR